MSDLNALAALASAAPKGTLDTAAARKTAQAFESSFLNTLLESMSAGLKSDGPFGGGEGEETYRSFLNEAIAQQIAKRGGLGIADHVYREILRMQEAKLAGAAP